jgi:ABC-type transport system substrate-binding protein|tara:strand:+ start:4385 stop:6061 length:1677 start_codon:yes stop_codon:yes gene_type:complete
MDRKVNILFIFFFLISSIPGQDTRKSFIRYTEKDLPRVKNPYLSGKQLSPQSVRFYALFHETFFEIERQKTYSNITLDDNIKVIEEDLPDGIRAQFLIPIPGKSDLTLYFHGNKRFRARPVRGQDLLNSIKYAIAKELLPSKLFKLKNVYLDKNGDLRISFDRKMVHANIVQYLSDIYILPSNIFTDEIINKIISSPNSKSFPWEEKTEFYKKYPIGMGPFQFDKKDKDWFYLKRFDNTPTPPNSPRFDGVAIKKEPLKGQMVDRLFDGDVNLIMDMPRQLFGGTSSFSKIHYFDGKIEKLEASMLCINHTNPHLKKRDFRKAIAKSYRKSGVIRNKFNSDAVPLSGPYAKKHDFTDHSITGYKFDDKTPMQLMTKMGYDYNSKREELSLNGKPVTLKLIYKTDITNKEEEALRNSFVHDLLEIGITVQIQPVVSLNWYRTLANKNNWDLAYYSVSTLGSQTSLSPLYGTGKSNNFQRYSNPDVDKLFSQLENQTEPALRRRSGKQIHKLLHEDVASIFLWTLNSWYVFNKNEIHEDNHTLINGDNFFTTPHKWKPAD